MKEQLSDPFGEFATPFWWSLSSASQLSTLRICFLLLDFYVSSLGSATVLKKQALPFTECQCMPGTVLTWFPVDHQVLGG